jgi:hypothetical protein
MISAWLRKCLSAGAGNQGFAFAVVAEQALFVLKDAVRAKSEVTKIGWGLETGKSSPPDTQKRLFRLRAVQELWGPGAVPFNTK